MCVDYETVVLLLLGSSCLTRKKPERKEKAACNPGGEMRAKGGTFVTIDRLARLD